MRELIDKHIDRYIGLIGLVTSVLILLIDWYVGVIGFIAIGFILLIGLKK
ncbi:MAG TPA: hypothetical protein QF468_01285 [Nitrospinota bacterium]|mgnify:FL=1|jgi:hypothetical protein|nr:hypothetical protein [Nitrospinota bacterium]|tara:strand:- start:10130 stop:10279 length:150 start_codon:yes stop_codon:yes gene_type:complete